MTRPASPARTRLTQSERTDAMRARLLKATMEVVQEEGWARASTPKICERAGVSRGAQTHHFPTKADLLLAAVREIVGAYQSEIEDEGALKGAHTWSLRKLFDLLWDACLQDGLMECWIEVMVAARTDRDLRTPVAALDRASLSAMRSAGRVAEKDAGDLASDIIELTVYLLRGMVVQRGVHPGEARRRRLFDLWVSIVSRLLTQHSGPNPPQGRSQS
jgi:AcrR family transcriptional regulator